jgi:thiosulfate/3-mercaptopyruvate sulfurtransferase
LVIDVRENGRYHGENEPIDLVAGHSWCINIPFTTNLNKTGNFTPVELRQNIKKVLEQQKMENIIDCCGSGVCQTLLAIDYAGSNAKTLRWLLGEWSETIKVQTIKRDHAIKMEYKKGYSVLFLRSWFSKTSIIKHNTA